MKEKLKEIVIRHLWNLGCLGVIESEKDNMVMAMKAYHTQPSFQKQCDEMTNEIYRLIAS